MREQTWVIIAVAFGVDCLLLVAANLLTGEGSSCAQLVLGGAIAALYTGGCVYLGHMSDNWERLLCLLLVAAIAFGVKRESVLPTIVFLALNAAAALLAKGIGDGHGAVAAALISALCLLCGNTRHRTVPVKLRYGAQELSIRALQDTGNCLQDPLTGDSVLVLGADAAQKLLGLEPHQLRDPVGTVAEGKVRGLRLIPYHTIAGKGLILALRIADVQIGRKHGSKVVAFAPCTLNEHNGFHGLTGGIA